ncbi:GAF domain-containing protein [Oscillatoria sp. FACHB-1407]|uniref:GAF domain-containing protein n=1 Tax=Oscillatoria sp. FACHB-1407 TaxID=2692847 RepID=UPI001686CB48|nr:GAF domain-containing protein [Oscillatoria sp. FACHB-1407]MBD2463522.1 GAF domain-containing protein [Oscillatoria sp. FACHB-1407]
MDTALAKLHDRLAALEQENARLRSRLESCERSYAVSQAEVARYRQPKQDEREPARQAEPDEWVSTGSSSLEHHLLETTAEVARVLLTLTPLNAAVNTALGMLGEALDTDRINVIENFDSFCDSPFPRWRALEYEWTSLGIVPQHANGKAGQGSYEEIQWLYELFQQGQTASYLIDEAPEPFRSEQMAIGVKSTHLVPISVEGQWWGVVGLDDCRAAKQRSAAELTVLKIATDCIGSAIERDRTQQALLQAEQERTHNAAKHSQELERLNAELRQTLEHLTESEERYRTLFELSSEGIYRWQLDQPISIASPVDEQVERIRHSLYVAEANAAYAAMYGLPTTDAASGLRLSNIHIPTSGKNLEFLRRWIENGYRIRAAESEEITPEGKRCYFFNNVIGIVRDGHLIGGWGTQLDISELRETQQALLEVEQKRSQELERINAELQQTLDHLTESEQRYRQLMELASEGIFRVEYEQPIPIHLPVEEQAKQIYQQFRYAEHNLAFAQMYGYDEPDALVGTPLAHVMEAPENAAQMEQFVRNGHQMRNQETIEFDRFGQKRYFLNNGFSIIRDSYAIGGWGTQIDITELRETQQALLEAEQAQVAELKKANEALARTSQRLSEQPDLSAFLSHVALEAIAQLDADAAMISMLDKQHQTLRAVAHVEQGRVASGLGAEMPINEAEFVNLLLETRKPRYFDLEREAHLFWPGAIAYHQQRHHQAVIAVPLFAGAEFLGHLGLAFTHTNPINEQSSELLYALAQQAALSIQLTRLAEEAKQAAIAREQEKSAQERAAELAKANEALKRSVDVLATQTDLNQFIGHVLRLAAEQFDAPLAEYWETTDPNIGRIVGWWGHNQIHGFGQPHNHPASKSGVRVPSHMLEQGQFSDRRKHFVAPFDHSVQPAEGEFSDDPASWYASFGVNLQLNLPLIVGETCFGVLNFWQSSDHPFTEQQIELGYALAQQVTLAIRLSQLAEEAKQAAIAREQEKAAQERTTELSRANTLLRNSLGRLSTNPNLDDILGHLLVELVSYVGASVGHIFIHDAGQNTLNLKVRCQDGQAFWTPDADEPVFFQSPILVEQTQIFTQLSAQPRLAILNQPDFEENLWQGVPEWFQAKDYQGTSSCILMVGDRPLGWLAMAFAQPIAFSPVEEELILALAQQIALVIQLNLLSEAEKQKAIAREQEEAAQDRAAELAKVNQALGRSLDKLANDRNLDSFLEHVLHEALQMLDGTVAQFFMYDPDSSRLRPSIAVNSQREALPAPGLMEGLSILSKPFPANITGAWERLLDQRCPIYLDLNQDASDFWPGMIDWHRQRGHSGVICTALMMGDQPLGLLGVALCEQTEITAAEFEFFQALGQQATLAIQLTQLAEEAKQLALFQERNHIAREIHDTLAQGFAGILMQLQAVLRFVATEPEQAQMHLNRARDLARSGLVEARRSVWVMRQDSTEYSDFVQLLGQLAEQMAIGTPVRTQVQVQGVPYRLRPEVGINLLRIAQEAITNALRHANAQTIELELCYDSNYVRLQIRDDGRGFNPQTLNRGLGLMGMQQRADLINAQLRISSSPSKGTTISAMLLLFEEELENFKRS